jgi:predicted metalloprotease with PDZ domain
MFVGLLPFPFLFFLMKRFFSLCLFFSLTALFAADYTYTLTWLEPHTHTLVVEAEVGPQTNDYTDFCVPAWRPGRYYLQNYAASVFAVAATDEAGQPLSWEKVSKDCWRVFHEEVTKVRLRYHFLANNQDAGSSYYTDGQVYFNPVNLFMYQPGKYEGSVELRVPDLPTDWKVATSLSQPETTRFTADSYHEFVDAPTVFAREMVQLSFEEGGTMFHLHFQGASYGGAKVFEAAVEPVRAIVREQGAIFGAGFPFESYHFIYRLLPYRMRHAVEHTNSASFALPAEITETPERLVNNLKGITAHEFWHAWNVKRIRPAPLWPYDYSQPQYSRLHWFTEGVTEYMTHLTLIRADLIDEKTLYQRLANTLGSLENNYATSVVSPSLASFDSWLATSSYPHPAHGVSYYTLGDRVGLLIDLKLRAETNGEQSLDKVFAYLYETYYQEGHGVPENGVQLALESLSGVSWEEFFAQYVHGTEPVPYDDFFAPMGLTVGWEEVEAKGPRSWGILQTEEFSQGIVVKRLHLAGDAYRDGLAEGDLILEVAGQAATGVDLDAYLMGETAGKSLSLKVYRDGNMLDLTLRHKRDFVPQKALIQRQKKLKKEEEQLLEGWLQGE